MLDTYRIRARIKEIRKRITTLDKNFKGIPQEQFLQDETANAAAERNLQIAIQACLDIANHIVAALGLERPIKETAEAFVSLAQEKIIPETFVDTMVKITGYRNILVHGYLDVNRHITYDNIRNHLVDLSKFARYIENFLERQAKNK
ncbi:hypothetical protein A2697_00945 [Candidatus Curtissbacteria bacterium RIFCSPHIGHO2_01_FULL_41_44]|uniref:DUF86 domain-containing protein n=1 Tax=Candidatus Curtissbacteria bacterium RIFCSPLOWO2_01_FULL_42_50 TaxID=1797730 RepID=A0A1F5H5M2_9BACT|nr:MAG: hypothetical protein A3C33_04585 [Candidatus Curtissbacteria bacterium RIFCSPHIGHO2_02_FULL_42_58]OGD93942.1 MAG: hypothetical protein A2697_00945 [Candidatus Curtissbacteria bacterium RIFCSPHIGHO2_01_FULL_41_44]OGD97440.1 MAG: hypothetical protein A3E71_04495 [Candidatus Curtissbacteria bacterium RIFCSPHIGHO2_12_FULL_42_33]OGD99401.1 MAG: hypothetical protein A3B54_00200 [Candidatus Curtissbacteria bacterium RIFCSPLOWO2_01_FULL_42_50]OGE03548.1 MAG: hypothetical protein A3G16_00715 [Ca